MLPWPQRFSFAEERKERRETRQERQEKREERREKRGERREERGERREERGERRKKLWYCSWRQLFDLTDTAPIRELGSRSDAAF